MRTRTGRRQAGRGATKAAEVISQETGVKVYSLDPIVTGESNNKAYDDYINKMNNNLKVLQEALK